MHNATTRAALAAGMMLAFTAGLGLARSATAQPVVLEFYLPTGTTFDVQSSESMQLQAQVSDGFGNQQQMSQAFESPTNYKVEVMQAAPGGIGAPIKTRFSFEPGLAMTINDGQNGQQEQPVPYAGKVFTVSREEDGRGAAQVSIDPAQGLAPETQQVLEAISVFDESTLLPGRPVQVGEQWNPDTTKIREAAGLAPGGTLTMTATLTGMDNVSGRVAALLDIEVNWNATVQGLVMKGPQRGKAAIDLETGLLLMMELGGQLQVSAAPETGMQMSGSSTLVSKRFVKNLTVPQGMPGPEPAVEDIPTEITEDGIVMTTPDFAGTYSNNELSVMLIEGEPRKIEIRRGETVSLGTVTGGREINQNANADGTVSTQVKFGGTFEHGEAEYPFSVEQYGDGTMKFKTGKTTHELREEVAAAPVEPNPFE